MSLLKIEKFKLNNDVEINLPFSKSESNRALIMRGLSGMQVEIVGLSTAKDTIILAQLLNSKLNHLNSQEGGTTFRFLCSYLSIQNKDFILTASERMKNRPIGDLVMVLNQIGANIEYIQKVGYPPITIKSGFLQKESDIKIRGDVSSQFISSLAMIAPCLPQGLQIRLTTDLTSKPYLEMTLKMMEMLGVESVFDNRTLFIKPSTYKPSKIIINKDWSAASYWYQLCAFINKSSFFLKGLTKNSLQGDSIIATLMEDFGVYSEFSSQGVLIVNKGIKKDEVYKNYNCSDYPDLAQTLIATCAGLQINAKFTGLHTLKIKETNRIKAMKSELKKINVEFREEEKGVFIVEFLNSVLGYNVDKIIFDTYDDHRMAMALAPLGVFFPIIYINNAEVVQKSYQNFWTEMKKVGFKMKKII